MAVTLAAICIVGWLILRWIRRTRDRHELERHSITADDLRALMAANRNVLLFDVRLPLDLLAHAEIIPGAKRIAPEELRKNPTLIPREKDSIVYCTCPGEETSRIILQRALKLGFLRMKFLKGGLMAWKESGFPVEPYQHPFHLDTGT